MINYAEAAYRVRRIMTRQAGETMETRVTNTIGALVATYSMNTTQAVKFVYSYLKDANESARSR